MYSSRPDDTVKFW